MTPEKENPEAETAAPIHHEPAKVADILPPPSDEALPVTSDEIAAALAEAMPEPTESKQIPGADTEAASPPPPVSENPFPFEQDPKGQTFDPEKHALGADGKPKRNSRNFFVSKKIGRPRGDSGTEKRASGSSYIAEDSTVGETPATGGPDRFTLAADSYFDFGVGILAAFLSAEVLPDSPEQKKLITLPLADTLRKHDAAQIEPEMRLFLGCGVYAVAKYQKPTVRERVRNFVAKMRGKKVEQPAAETATP